MDDRGLYAPGQLWLDRKVLLLVVLVVFMVLVVLVLVLVLALVLVMMFITNVWNACCLRTLWADTKWW